MVYPALLSLMRTPRLPVVDWTDAPADLNGLVCFAERRNLVSVRVCHHISYAVYSLRAYTLEPMVLGRLRLKCDGTRAETRFRLSAKRTSSFKSARVSVQSTTGSRGVCISGSNAGYTVFRGSVKGTGYPLHSPVSTSLSLQCLTMCHHISTGL